MVKHYRVRDYTAGATNTEEAAVTRGTTAHCSLGVRATTGAAQQPAATTAPQKSLLETPGNTPVDLVEKSFSVLEFF